MNAVNALPTSAQMMPEAMPPMSAARNSHLGVGDECVHDREQGGDDQVRQNLPRGAERPCERRKRIEPHCKRAVLGACQQSECDGEQDGTDDHHAQIFDEAARETSRVLDTPHEIETGFDLLNGGDHGVGEKSQSDRAEENAAHVGDELHDAFGQFRCRAAQRAEEFIQQESQISVRAPAFQNRKTEDHQRYDRKQRRIGQAHCADADFAVQPIADQGRRIARQAQHRAPRRTQGARADKQRIFQGFNPFDHEGRLLSRLKPPSTA